MSPGWLALAMAAAGIAALANAAPRAWSAEGERPRQWRIQVCDAAGCELRGKALSGPTACSLDLASLAIVVESGKRLSCVKAKEMKR